MKKLVVITSGMYPSHGVLNLVKYISYSLIKNKTFRKKYDLKILVFDENFSLRLKKIIYNLIMVIRNLFFKEKKRIHKFANSAAIFFQENYELRNHIEFFSNNHIYKKLSPDLVFPLQDKIIKKKFKSLGYIFDLQHIDLPNYFGSYDIKMRNKDFRYLIKKSDGILVNSLFVKKGLLKNFDISPKKINTIPFLPYIYDTIKKKNIDIKKKYNIKNNYFLICNHFWKHKNHELVFKTFSQLQKIKKNLNLICTGVTHDSRFPNYFKSLTKKYDYLLKNRKIQILDLIPRSDQLELIKNCLAMIQPSLYEGGPGGFSSYEAICFKKKIILADIKINKEIKYKNLFFFKNNSSKDLLKKMKIILNKNNSSKISINLKNNQKKLGVYFLNLIDKTLNDRL